MGTSSEDGMKKMSVICKDFPGGSLVKNPPSNTGDTRVTGLIPGSGRSPGEGIDNPLSYSCLENSMDGGAWRTTVHGIVKSQPWLSDWAQIARCDMHKNAGHTEGAEWMLLFWLSRCCLDVQSVWSLPVAGICRSHWEGLCRLLGLVLWDDFPSLKSSCYNYPKDRLSLWTPALTITFASWCLAPSSKLFSRPPLSLLLPSFLSRPSLSPTPSPLSFPFWSAFKLHRGSAGPEGRSSCPGSLVSR